VLYLGNILSNKHVVNFDEPDVWCLAID